MLTVNSDYQPGVAKVGANLVKDNNRLGIVTGAVSKVLIAVNEILWPLEQFDNSLTVMGPAGEYLKGTVLLSDFYVWLEVDSNGEWLFLKNCGDKFTKMGATVATHMAHLLDAISLLASVKLLDLVAICKSVEKVPVVNTVVNLGLKVNKAALALLSGTFSLIDSLISAGKKVAQLKQDITWVDLNKIFNKKLLLSLATSILKITVAAMVILAMNAHPAFLIAGALYTVMQVWQILLTVEADLQSEATAAYERKALTRNIPLLAV